jgi:hypothetical protein
VHGKPQPLALAKSVTRFCSQGFFEKSMSLSMPKYALQHGPSNLFHRDLEILDLEHRQTSSFMAKHIHWFLLVLTC